MAEPPDFPKMMGWVPAGPRTFPIWPKNLLKVSPHNDRNSPIGSHMENFSVETNPSPAQPNSQYSPGESPPIGTHHYMRCVSVESGPLGFSKIKWYNFKKRPSTDRYASNRTYLLFVKKYVIIKKRTFLPIGPKPSLVLAQNQKIPLRVITTLRRGLFISIHRCKKLCGLPCNILL